MALCVVISLTVISWLYTPYIFNPYQFFHEDYWDMRHWWNFFFKEGGRQWFEWYTEKQLQPMSGVRVTPSDLFIWIIFVFSWYTVLITKVHLLSVVLPSTVLVLGTNVLAVVPPIGLNMLVVCPAIALLWPGASWSARAGHRNGMWCGKLPTTGRVARSIAYQYWRLIPTRLRRAGETHVKIGELALFSNGVQVGCAEFTQEWSWQEVCADGRFAVSFEKPTRVDSYTFSTGEDEGRDPIMWRLEGSNDGVSFVTVHENKLDALTPLGRGVRLEPQAWHNFPPRGLMVALVVVILADIGEAVACLVPVMLMGWWKTFLIGLLLKYSLLSLLLVCAESAFRLRGSVPQLSMCSGFFLRLKDSVKLWLCAHRLAADIAVSALIMLPLSAFVAGGYVLKRMCHCTGFSIHQLLVFRSPGQPQSQELSVPITQEQGQSSFSGVKAEPHAEDARVALLPQSEVEQRLAEEGASQSLPMVQPAAPAAAPPPFYYPKRPFRG